MRRWGPSPLPPAPSRALFLAALLQQKECAARQALGAHSGGAVALRRRRGGDAPEPPRAGGPAAVSPAGA